MGAPLQIWREYFALFLCIHFVAREKKQKL